MATSSSDPQLNESTAVSSSGLNGSETTQLSPAQQRQLEADAEQPVTPPSNRRSRNIATPPNLLSEGDFPSLASTKASPAPKPVGSWGVKKSPSPAVNGVNGKSASSSRASTPAPTPRRPFLGAKNLQSNIVTENVRFNKDQLQNPKAKDFKGVIDKLVNSTKVDKIQVSRMEVAGTITFSITGKPENVHKAKRQLWNEVGIKVSDSVSAPASVLPFVIGKNHANLNSIREISGAKVTVPTKKDSASEEEEVQIMIEGLDFEVARAKEELNKIIDARTSRKTEHLNIPADFHVLIAGVNDANIEQWEGERDIKIRIPNVHDPASVDEPIDLITLTGHRDVVAEVKEKIERLYEKLKAETHVAHIELVPRAKHRFIIGNRGDGIKELLAETGCAVIVPPLWVEAANTIEIRGTKSQIGIGLSKVLEREAALTIVTVDLTSFYGAGEDGIVNARNFYRYAKRRNLFSNIPPKNVNLSLPKEATENSFVFEIDGKDAEQVRRAETTLKNLITSFPPEKFLSLEVDPCVHGIVFGKKDQSIKDQHVHCLFEPSDPEILLVYEGSKDPQSALQAVKEHLETVEKEASEDIDERTLKIPRKYHGIIAGPNGSTLNALIGDQSENAAGVKVHVYLGGKSADADEDVVIVRGPRALVARVSKNIEEHVAESKHTEPNASHVEEFTIPEEYSKNIIGKGGKRIQELREKYAVTIKVDEGKVYIQGIKRNAEEAKKSIVHIVDELKDDTSKRLHVKNEHHGHLIGEKGANVRRLQERYGVRIHFPRREDESTEEDNPQNPDEIVVRGPSKGVKSAVDELNALLEYRIKHSHSAELEILARGRQRLIRNGILQSLRQDPGYVRIDIPARQDNESDDAVITIKIEGTEAFVKKATKEIASLRDEVKDETTRTVVVDQKHHKGLIGPGGRSIQKVIIDCGGPEDRSAQARIVRFPRPGEESDKIILAGPRDIVDKLAEKFVKFSERETIELDIPSDKLSRIIGTGGKKRMELESEFDVSIYVPPVNRGASKPAEKVKVTGNPEQNEKAKKAIMEIVKSGDGLTVQVPRRLHHRVSNDGRTKNELRRRFQVYVSHDGAEIPRPVPTNGALGRIDEDEEQYPWHVMNDPEDSSNESIPWKLRGQESNLQKAKRFLEETIESAGKLGNWTGNLGVPPVHHHLVIGTGGQRISQIRQETDCTVDVPRRGDGNDVIVIRGTREGIEKAKDMILESVENRSRR